MNNEFVMVPRETVDQASELLQEYNKFGIARELSDILAQPAEQHQGEQVASMPIERCYDVRAKMIIAFNEAKKAGSDLDDCLDAAYKAALRYSPNPLNASVDPSEVERLRSELVEWKERCQRNNDQAMEWMAKYDNLRAQLAERDALLREAVDHWNIPGCGPLIGTMGRIEAALSASAEPSAPVEIDERAEFEQASEPDGANLDRNSVGDYINPYVQSAWEGWNMRASLERKP